LQSYMRIFGQENLGRPDLEVDGEMNAVRKYLAKHMEESEIPGVNALLVFASEDIEIDAEDAPVPTMKLKEIKEFFRKKAKEKVLSSTQLAAVKAALPE
jgi:hypothetical protein